MVQAAVAEGPIAPQAFAHTGIDELRRAAVAARAPDAVLEVIHGSIGVLDGRITAIGNHRDFGAAFQGPFVDLGAAIAIGGVVNEAAVAGPAGGGFVAAALEEAGGRASVRG